jgi:hypothetical protein
LPARAVIADRAVEGDVQCRRREQAVRLIPACADFDSRWDSQDADFLIRCSEQEEARDGGSDWGSNGLHIGGFAAVGAALW